MQFVRTLCVFPAEYALQNIHSRSRSNYTLGFLQESDSFTRDANYISFRRLQNLLTFSDFLHTETRITERGKRSEQNMLLSCLPSKKNKYDELPSHISNLVHFVNCFYSSVGSESSEGASDDNGPKMPSELRVNPLCEEGR
jgi:hypothetical protein